MGTQIFVEVSDEASYIHVCQGEIGLIRLSEQDPTNVKIFDGKVTLKVDESSIQEVKNEAFVATANANLKQISAACH